MKRAAVEAVIAQVRALELQLIALLEEEDADEGDEHPCPRCRKREFVDAGEGEDGRRLVVCATTGCNANLLATEDGWEVVNE